MFNRKELRYNSPSRMRDYIWVAEYQDGTWLPEYYKEWNDFSAINKSVLKRFGYIGHGNQLYFESNGEFKFNCNRINFSYKVKDTIYKLSNTDSLYNDIIQYKDACGIIDYRKKFGTCPTEITQYNFGYKTQVTFNEFYIRFKPIVSIPATTPIFFTVTLMSDKDLYGTLQITVNDILKDVIYLPIQANKNIELSYRL